MSPFYRATNCATDSQQSAGEIAVRREYRSRVASRHSPLCRSNSISTTKVIPRCTSRYAFSAVTSSERACLRRRAKDKALRSRFPGVTYSADLGDRRGGGKDSKWKIETSVGTREHGKQWVILFGQRGSAYPRGKLCAPSGDAPYPMIFRERIFRKSIGFPLDETAGGIDQRSTHSLSTARVSSIGSLFQAQGATLRRIPLPLL